MNIRNRGIVGNNFRYLSITLGFIFVILLKTDAYAALKSQDPNIVTEEDVYHDYITKEIAKREFDALYIAKNAIMSGQLEKAEFFLQTIDENKSKLASIKLKYLSMVHFLLGEHAKSVRLLEHPRMQALKEYSEVCVLKLINYVALDEVIKLNKEYYKCIRATESFSSNGQLWLESIWKAKNKDEKTIKGKIISDIGSILASTELTRIWLKLALYLNHEEKIKPFLKNLPFEAYRSEKVRELLGLVYYRLGETEQALKFIEDLDGPNAENIKGNIALGKREYEVAFGHFNLALKKKKDSINALERAIPLSWLLGQYTDGLQLANKIVGDDDDLRSRAALRSALFIIQDNFEAAEKELRYLSYLFRGQLPRRAEIMKSYIALIKKERYELNKYSSASCRLYDGMNCWMKMSLSLWPDFPQTIERDDNILSKEIDIEEMKNLPEGNGIQESSYISQKEIKELDDIESSKKFYKELFK